MSTEGVLGAAWLPTDGYLDPTGLTMALAAGARARGVPIAAAHAGDGRRRSSAGGSRAVETDARPDRDARWSSTRAACSRRDRPHGGRHRAGHAVRAPVPGHRADRRACTPTCPSCATRTTSSTSARRCAGLVMGGYERNPATVRPGRHPGRLQRQAAAARLAALRGDQRRRHAPRAGHGRCGRPAADQRSGGLHAGQRVHPGRVGGARLLRGGRLQRPRHRRRGWHGAAGRQLDRRRRAGARPVEDGHPPLRRAVPLARLHARPLVSRTTPPTTTSTTRTRSARPARPLRLSPTYPRLVELELRVRREVGLGAAELVRVERRGAATRRSVRAAGRARTGRRRSGRRRWPRARRPRCSTRPASQDRDRRARRARLPPAAVRQRDGPAGRPHHLHPDAQPPRRDRVRLHRHPAGGGALLDRDRDRLRQPRPRLDAAPRAGRRQRPGPRPHLGARLPGHLGTGGPRHRRLADRRRPVERGVPVPDRPRDQRRPRAGARAAGHLRRRARLGAVLPDRVRARPVGRAVGGRAAATAWSPGGIGPSTASAWRRATGSGRRDITPEDNPYQAGLGFAVRLERAASSAARRSRRRKARPVERRLCCLVLDDPLAVALGNEPVRVDGEVVGRVTSGGYGFAVGAQHRVRVPAAALAEVGQRVRGGDLRRLDRRAVAAEPLYDPTGERVRA